MSGLLGVHRGSGIVRDAQRCRVALGLLAHRGGEEGVELREHVFLGARYHCAGDPSGAQPVTGSGIVGVFDGRLDNRSALASELAGARGRVDLSTDLALVVEGYAEWGTRLFEKLRGVWAIVLWDERERRLVAARHRLGLRPLYSCCAPGELIVSSEIKSILALAPEAHDVDVARLREFVSHGWVDDWTATLFSRIRPVPPGGVLAFDGDRTVTTRLSRLHPMTDPALTLDDVRDRLVVAVERHTPTDLPVGIALSGGIDSASLAGVVARPPLREARSVHAFSIEPPQTASESPLVEATVRRTGLSHEYVPVDGLDHRAALARLVDAHDEPVPWSGVLYQFVLRRAMAESGRRAVLVGYGADEIFAGYPYLARPFFAALAARGRVRDLVRFARGAPDLLGTSRLGLVRHLASPAVARAKGSLGRQLVRARSEDVLLPPGAPDPPARPPEDALELDGVDGGRVFFRALHECFRTNMSQLVRLEDRNAAAHGLELGMPFMDEDLVLTALSFPYHRYLEGGRNKAILRDAVEDLLAPEVALVRGKMATPGNDNHVVFELLRPELLDVLGSGRFHELGIWSPACRDLYVADAAARVRGGLWFRVYVAYLWHERVVRPAPGARAEDHRPPLRLPDA